MPRAAANGIQIEYETTGDPGRPAVLLVAGLGGQLITWDDAVGALASGGFFAVRYDNRDAGLSTKFHGRKAHIEKVWTAVLTGRTPDVEYTLSDMAADGIALMDLLGIDRAHVVGISMGGMIGQVMAFEHPDRLASLTSIMSTTGANDVGQAAPRASTLLTKAVPSGRSAAVEATVAGARITWGPHFFDETRARARATAAYDRSFYPEGSGRQMAAMLASGDRTEALQSVRVPTLVIHGDADPLIDVSGGYATAAAIPDADLLIIDKMGHDIPPERFQIVRDAILSHLRRHC